MDNHSAPTNKKADDIYRAFEARLREESKKVNVSIRSPYLLDEDTTRLTSQVQQVIQEELAKNNEAKLQSFKERLQASKKRLERSPIEEGFPSPIEEREVNVMLEGLNLPEENKNRLTSQIQQMLGEELAKNAGARREAGRTCICAGGRPPGREAEILNPIEPGHPEGVYFDEEDGLKMTVYPRSDIPKTETVVSLKLDLRSNWSKVIWAWDACKPSYPGVARVFAKDNSSDWQYMRLYSRCEGGQTLVFRKPKEFGFWHDVGHLFNSPRAFWNLFGGCYVNFKWYYDG
jgi:hypothetical protein